MSKKPTKILLVEDNPGDANLLREMLNQFHFDDSDFELVEAPRLVAAIKRLQESHFDVVLLDLSLPDSQGMATVARVRETRPTLPIVVLTGEDDDELATEALRRGAQDYLVKGQFDRRMLMRGIRYAIERQRSEAQLRRQRERETALRDVAEAVASTLDRDTVLNLFLDKFESLFPNLAFTARLVDPKTGSLEPFAFRNVEEIGWKSGPSPDRNVRARAVMALGKPLVLVDLLSDPHLGSSNFIKRNGFVSYAGIPLVAKGHSIGVIGVYSKQRHEFERDEVEFFSALGRQAAVAIYNSRMHEQALSAHERESVLREIASALAGTLDVHAVLSVLLANIHSRLPHLVATVRLLDRTIGDLMGLAPRDANDNEWKDVAVARAQGLTQVVAGFKRPVSISDLQNDRRTSQPDFFRRNGFVSYLGVPLMAGDDILGVLNFYTKEKYVFAIEEVEFLRILADQAAIAIHNSQLYERLRTANERQSTLQRINSAVASTLDSAGVLNLLMEQIDRFLPYAAMQIWLRHHESGIMERAACRNTDEAEWKGRHLDDTPPMIKEAVTGRKCVVSQYLLTDPRTLDPEYFHKQGLVSYLAVPLLAKDEVVGVLCLLTREEHQFSGAEIDFLSTLGSEAAMAIHNAQLYARLKDSNEVLEKTLEAKSILTGVMAHELKTPIQVILGSASMLADNLLGELTSEQRRSVRVIETGAGELLELIDHTLQMARLEHGRTVLAVTEVGVCALLGELKAEFEGPFREKGVELEIDALSPGIMAMKTDRIKLKEILRNLIDNARKYTPQGKVTVRAAKIGEERVEFVVSDTGVGIRADLLPKIFDLFYQVSYLDKEKASAGLGLSIVKRLVEALSGEIEVSSEVGKGTTFRVSLPREIASEQPDEVLSS
ncbi:MAG: GAF domain-containing protein [Deltaproteobacteria bacterium]|nr:GAF domain-containing protein [Deltaproteobacteria bacterium]